MTAGPKYPSAAAPAAGKRMLVKVCGLREAENIRAVSSLDIDWIGFIFYPPSPRYMLDAQGSFSALAAVPVSISAPASPKGVPLPDVSPTRPASPRPRRVGVFVDESLERMAEIAEAFQLDYLQLHGNETPDTCYALQKRGFAIIKAFSVACGSDLRQTAAYEGRADYFLFDTRCTGYGGSGRCFDWTILAGYTGQTPFLLSGGIGPGHLEALRSFRHPRLAGIDLNSAFESCPGRKDIGKLADFIRAYRTGGCDPQ